MNDFLSELQNSFQSQMLPDHDELLALTDEAITVLESEDAAYRPRSEGADGQVAGGLLDFTAQPVLPLIVVPDLHARCDFFMHLLTTPLVRLGLGDGLDSATGDAKDATVLSALFQKKIRVVCVGDLFHSETRGKARWLTAWDAYARGDYENADMTSEMQENLTLFQLVLRVKNAFPAAFHFLKGNHENILNEGGRGNYPFRKFADEGNMVYDFMASHYGDAVLHVMSLWEHALPLCAAFPACVVSHAEPRAAYTRQEIIDAEKNPAVVLGLTWTANDEAAAGSVRKTLQELLGGARAQNAVWLSGHRPVRDRYALRQNGALVQIHNPAVEQVAVVHPARAFHAETDIILLVSEAGS